MPRMAPLSCLIYRRLLIFYPQEFRSRFAEEMVESFEELRRDALRCRGRVGMLSVWSTASWELFSVALPLRLKSSPVVPALLSFAISSALAWAFFRAFG
jgi:hypothetical protein